MFFHFQPHPIAAMEERGLAVLDHWDRPEITLDLDYLVKEHVQRADHFAKRMAEVPIRAQSPAQWGGILDAIASIETRPDFLAVQQYND